MATAKAGDTVKVHYTGFLSGGEEFDTSRGRDPIEFKIGADQVIPGFEAAVTGMEIGASKHLTIPAAEAYGLHSEDLMLEVPNDQIPEEVHLEVGDHYQLRGPNGEAFDVVVAEIKEDGVTLDANHPLAGLDLTFDIELVAIE